jgi:hypothetical protein
MKCRPEAVDTAAYGPLRAAATHSTASTSNCCTGAWSARMSHLHAAQRKW